MLKLTSLALPYFVCVCVCVCACVCSCVCVCVCVCGLAFALSYLDCREADETVVDDDEFDDEYVTQDELQSAQEMLDKVRREKAAAEQSPDGEEMYAPFNPAGSTEDRAGSGVRDPELAALLSSTNMTQYAATFAREGIDDVGILCEYGPEELKDVGVKGGHARRLLSAAHALNPQYQTAASRMAYELRESKKRLMVGGLAVHGFVCLYRCKGQCLPPSSHAA